MDKKIRGRKSEIKRLMCSRKEKKKEKFEGKDNVSNIRFQKVKENLLLHYNKDTKAVELVSVTEEDICNKNKAEVDVKEEEMKEIKVQEFAEKI